MLFFTMPIERCARRFCFVRHVIVQEMTADEAHNLQAVDASIRKKASALASLRSEVDQERALQETLLCESARPDSAT